MPFVTPTGENVKTRTFRQIGAVLKWSLVVGALLVVVLVIATVVSFGNATDKSGKAARQVTPSAYAQVTKGMSASRAREILGKPEHTDELVVAGIRSRCWYYGLLAGRTFQFCFDNGRLVSKARY